MLGDVPLIASVSTADPDASRAFYGDRLGLAFVADEPHSLVFEAPNAMLRVAKVEAVTPSRGTVLGWEVPDLDEVVESLTAGGVDLLRYDGLGQDERGVATLLDGVEVAWFADPDGNVLSATAFPEETGE